MFPIRKIKLQIAWEPLIIAAILMDKQEIAKYIAANLRRVMNEKSLSLSKLAQRSSVSAGTLSKILNGHMSVTVPLLSTIAEGLGCGLEELLQGLADFNSVSKKTKDSLSTAWHIAIISISNRRITCIKDAQHQTLGTSSLEGGLDLMETPGKLMSLIQESITAALSDTKVSSGQLKQAVLKLVTQSYEFEESRQRFTHYAEKTFSKVICLSDWQITYHSSFGKKPGISLIVEKGVSLVFRHHDKLQKLGGWKFPVYDLGGENWLGLETIRHTVEAVEGYVDMSELAHQVLAKFNGKLETITESCCKGNRQEEIFCLLAETLFRAYFTDDPAAKEIIQRGFKHIKKIIDQIDQIVGRPLSIAINGSLADIYRPLIDQNRLIQSDSDDKKAETLAIMSDEVLSTLGVVID